MTVIRQAQGLGFLHGAASGDGVAQSWGEDGQRGKGELSGDRIYPWSLTPWDGGLPVTLSSTLRPGQGGDRGLTRLAVAGQCPEFFLASPFSQTKL